MGRRVAALDTRVAGLRPAWSGAAGDAARERLTGLRTELTDVLPALIEVDQVLAELAARLRGAKARLATAVALAEQGRLLVDRSDR
ncbi:hypothetical protein DKT69_37465, partial [Micromonospora sicca]